MLKNIVTVIFIFLIFFDAGTALAQTSWNQAYGGASNEEGYYARQTSDGGYILTGYTYSFAAGNSDIWLIKTDAGGDTLWTKTFGGTDVEEGVTVIETSDNGYVLTGFTGSSGAGALDLRLIKTDAAGNLAWSKTLGGTSNDFGNSIYETADSGFLIMGSTSSFGAGNSDCWLIRTDSGGDTLWTRTFGGLYNDIAFSGQPTQDGGCVLVGYRQPSGFTNSDAWLIKTDGNGDVQWTSTLGGNQNEIGYAVVETSDQGYIMTGYTASYGAGNFDLWLVKTDSVGDTLWTKTYGGSGNDVGNAILQAADGGYIVCGYTNSFSSSGDMDLWLIRTDAAGDSLWTMTFGGSGAEVGYSVNWTADSNLIVSGYTTSFGAGSKDAWLLYVVINPQTGIGEISSGSKDPELLLQSYPNPFQSSTSITFTLSEPCHVLLEVYNITGTRRLVLVDEDKAGGTFNAILDGSDLPDGIYICRLQAGNMETVKEIILVR